ncbi:hypothetical protein RJT34_14512 [Clitoria ternatea]|uniref:Protein kinase domain-containing protein n=1 Tax=Clitoria ternatea TaxID=43366 RepID=A0AAN9PN83_CLITE
MPLTTLMWTEYLEMEAKFIPNGNLFEYLHEPNEELPMTWDVRLRIAAEVAGALFYLHSNAFQPIYHRDIKSTNILLDEQYNAKVADFGTSRMVAVDATHLTTMVRGTFGYLDPEYLHTGRFTERSDVYSFGVVLVELLTNQRPIFFPRPNEAVSLASYFDTYVRGNRLLDIVHERIRNEGEQGHIIAVANLARRCLNFRGVTRPTMREVTMDLEGILNSGRNDNIQETHDDELGLAGMHVYSATPNIGPTYAPTLEDRPMRRTT